MSHGLEVGEVGRLYKVYGCVTHKKIGIEDYHTQCWLNVMLTQPQPIPS